MWKGDEKTGDFVSASLQDKKKGRGHQLGDLKKIRYFIYFSSSPRLFNPNTV